VKHRCQHEMETWNMCVVFESFNHNLAKATSLTLVGDMEVSMSHSSGDTHV
jgi:hypothetical protein